MLTLLAQYQQVGNTLDIAAQATTISPVQTLGRLVEMGAGAVLVVGTLAVLFYLIMGGFNWITAGGDKGKIESARAMLVQGIIGLAVLASAFAIFSLLLGFFGLRDRINLGFGGTGGGGGGGTQTAQTCSGGVAIGATVSTGGGNSYCRTGAAMVKCVGPGVGPSNFSYAHFEPCNCVNGAGDKAWDWQACP